MDFVDKGISIDVILLHFCKALDKDTGHFKIKLTSCKVSNEGTKLAKQTICL